MVGVRCANRCGCVSTPAIPRSVQPPAFSHDVEPLLYPTMPRCQVVRGCSKNRFCCVVWGAFTGSISKKCPSGAICPFRFRSANRRLQDTTPRPTLLPIQRRRHSTSERSAQGRFLSAARTRLLLGHRLRALLPAWSASSAGRRRNQLQRLLARLPAAGASASARAGVIGFPQ